ncbi:MAG TPA: BolA family protein [Noviherbaspirillum sp.]
MHAGHAGAASGGGHYKLRLVSDRFEGLNRIARHRLVYDCLRDMMHSDIHALTIIAFAPTEIS